MAARPSSLSSPTLPSSPSPATALRGALVPLPLICLPHEKPSPCLLTSCPCKAHEPCGGA